MHPYISSSGLCHRSGRHAFSHLSACEFGAHKINKNQLHHFKYHQRQKLSCMQCAAAAEERVRQLRERLKKSKRKCTCHCRMHQQAGQRRSNIRRRPEVLGRAEPTSSLVEKSLGPGKGKSLRHYLMTGSGYLPQC